MAKKHKALKVVLISVGAVVGLVIATLGGALIFAASTQLQVQDVEAMEVTGSVTREVALGQTMEFLTWNVGYGALDERQDCYWDGGKGVYGESEDVVKQNLASIKAKIQTLHPDFLHVQELDLDSRRSYFIDEYSSFKESFDGASYDASFARNFKAGLVPLPVTQMTGKVDAGIATFAKYEMHQSNRIQLPIPFSWPMSMFNLKRCLLVTHTPIEGSDKELATINLHLEAYDDGEGKAKQLAMLMDTMKQERDKGNYVIAAGDFNQTFSASYLERYPKKNDWVCPIIDGSLYPGFSFLMDDSHPTCRSLYKTYADADKTDFQYYMIDGYIVSDNVAVHSVETLDFGFENTDHNPVRMSFSLQ